MKKVFILSGFPGSGKSYYAETIKLQWQSRGEPHGCRILSADHYWGPDYDFKIEEIGAAHAWCFQRYLDALDADLPMVIVDNTNLSQSEISPYYLAAQAKEYEAVIYRISCPAEEAWKRQRHGVPFENFCCMVAQYKKRDVAPWWRVEEV